MTKQTAFNFSHRFYGNSLCMGLSQTFWKYASIFIDNCGFPKQNIFSLRLTKGHCASYHNITIHWAGEMQLQKKKANSSWTKQISNFFVALVLFLFMCMSGFSFLATFLPTINSRSYSFENKLARDTFDFQLVVQDCAIHGSVFVCRKYFLMWVGQGFG